MTPLLVKEGRDNVGTLIRLIKSPLCDGSLTQIIIFILFYTVLPIISTLQPKYDLILPKATKVLCPTRMLQNSFLNSELRSNKAIYPPLKEREKSWKSYSRV